MAYRPPIVPPKRSKSRQAREAAQTSVRRTALAKALRERLLEFFALAAQQTQAAGRPAAMFRDEPVPVVPPRPPFRGSPHLPPDGLFPPGRTGPVIDPQIPRPPQAAQPPSIYDWVRQPGFFAEDRAPMVGPMQDGAVMPEEDGSFVAGGGFVYDPDLGGFRASGRPSYF